MRRLSIGFATLFLGLVAVLSHAQAPVPLINQPLVPDATAPGGPQFTLTVNGTGFVSNSTVNWNGTPLATTFVSGSQLTAVVPATDLAKASTGWVTVVNPAPGGGTSNTAFFTVTSNIGNALAFTVVSSPGVVEWNQYSIVTGDFNGDGILDLAFSNLVAGTVSVLLGDGTGNFTLAPSLAASGPYGVAVGDFNGDGRLDLAVVNTWGQTVSIFLGDGTGNFTLASSPTVGGDPTTVAVGDFNGDGKLDLAVVNECATYPTCGVGAIGSVSILLGDGTGNFSLASTLWVGSEPYFIAVGDFNGDGKLDLAVSNSFSDTISILLGDGTGHFTPAPSVAVDRWPEQVAVGDFNGDGKLDLAVVNWLSYTISILLGDGAGNFSSASSPAPGGSGGVAVGDFNGDGILDLAVTGNDACPILLGDGTGNFTLATSPATSGCWFALTVGDFNGDGKLDVAVPGDTLLQVTPAPAVSLSPTSLSFGTQLVGTSAWLTLTLTNTGTAPLDITGITASANFSQTNTCGTSVAVGASCSITVTFTPFGVGTLTGTITVTDNASNSPQTVALTGVGTVVSLSPTSLGFNSQTVGTTSAPQTVTLTNSGRRPLTIAGIHIAGAEAGDFAQTNTCGTSVPAGSSCTISVTFTPQAKGPRKAVLGVIDNGGGAPQTVALRGYGT